MTELNGLPVLNTSSTRSRSRWRADKHIGCYLIRISLAMTLGSPIAASAACGGEGSCKDDHGNIEFDVGSTTAVKFAGQNTECDPHAEGALRYNYSSKDFEGCDGSAWRSLGVPANIIGMFTTGGCPSGWTAVPEYAGRSLVGSGSYTETVSGSFNPLWSHDYTLGENGGAAQVSLTTEQMPRHSHPARLTDHADDVEFRGLWTNDMNRQGYVEFDWIGTAKLLTPPSWVWQVPARDAYDHAMFAANGDGYGPFLSNGFTGGDGAMSSGQAQPFSNMMPYAVLTFCRKN